MTPVCFEYKNKKCEIVRNARASSNAFKGTTLLVVKSPRIPKTFIIASSLHIAIGIDRHDTPRNTTQKMPVYTPLLQTLGTLSIYRK